MRRGLMLGESMQDLRISLRGLFRAPLMSMTIVATVGLGIGATTVIFAAVNAALLQPLPYAEPARLVRIYTDAPPNKFRFSVADYLALAGAADTVRTDCGVHRSSHGLQRRQRGRTTEGTSGVIHVFRAAWHPACHRARLHATGWPARQPAGGHRQPRVLATATWRTPGRCGHPIRLDGADYALAGVLPPTPGPLEQRQEFFVAAQWDTPRRKGPFFITALGRLRHESAPIGGRRRTAGHQPAHLSAVAVFLSGREGVVEPDGPERRTSPAMSE